MLAIPSAAAPSPPRWSDPLLNAMRQTQDPPADRVVASLFASREVAAVNQLMRTLVAPRSSLS